jgi:predicted alpha/beta-hydrolase family hydrolase
VTELELQGPKRGADRAVLLAHGAGADMHAATLTTFADALAAAGVPVMRFNFPYRSAGRRAPDRPAVLAAATREAAAELARRTRLPPERLVLGGRSMGGRYASLAVGDTDDPLPALGLLLLGYPLHPAGKPEQLRVEHFPRIPVPVLFVSGTRDSLAEAAALRKHARRIRGTVSFHWIETADHGFKPLKSSGSTTGAALASAAITVVDWVSGLT